MRRPGSEDPHWHERKCYPLELLTVIICVKYCLLIKYKANQSNVLPFVNNYQKGPKLNCVSFVVISNKFNKVFMTHNYGQYFSFSKVLSRWVLLITAIVLSIVEVNIKGKCSKCIQKTSKNE